MTNHIVIAAAAQLDIYFCDPHSPWQRGTNENTNGLLRQYFPKGTDLSRHTPGDRAAVAAALNTRPARHSAGRHQPKLSTSTLTPVRKAVLRRLVESAIAAAIGATFS